MGFAEQTAGDDRNRAQVQLLAAMARGEKAALASLEIDAPNGKIKLDSNRQAIGTNFVTEVVDDGKGALFSKVVKVIPNVNQTLGYPPEVFAKIGLPSRTVPECKKY